MAHNIALMSHNAIDITQVYAIPSRTAIGAAILRGHEEIARLLLKPEFRLTPVEDMPELARATLAGARGGHPRLIQLLLSETSKSISDFPALGEEMLWVATRHGHENVVEMLVEHGVDIDVLPGFHLQEDHGRALSIAASRGNLRMVRFLLNHGARLTLENTADDPVEWAARSGHEEVVEMFLGHGASILTAFRAAAHNMQAHMVDWLLKKEATLLRAPSFKESAHAREALFQATFKKNPRMISMLVDAGISLSGLHFGQPIVTHAKRTSGKWIAEFLVSLGAEDQEIEFDETDGYYTEECIDSSYPKTTSRVKVSRRTWEWVGKY